MFFIDMGRHILYKLTIICLTFSYGVRHILGEQSEAVAVNSFANNSSENGDGKFWYCQYNCTVIFITF